MFTIYYCDDDLSAINRVKTLTLSYAEEQAIPLRFLDFARAEDLLFYIEDYLHEVNIIFLDIFMDELNGMDTAKKLREIGYKGEIIFISSSPDYVFEAFEVNSFNYLVKGSLDEEHFLKVLSEALKKVQNSSGEFLKFSMGADDLKVDIDKIHYFEIHRRVVTVIYDVDRTFDFYYSMDNLSEELKNKNFIRTHRSYLVNMNHIVSISKDHLLLKGSHEVPIGVTYYDQVVETFNLFLQSRWDS